MWANSLLWGSMALLVFFWNQRHFKDARASKEFHCLKVHPSKETERCVPASFAWGPPRLSLLPLGTLWKVEGVTFVLLLCTGLQRVDITNVILPWHLGWFSSGPKG